MDQTQQALMEPPHDPLNVRWVKMHPDSGSWHALQHESKVIDRATAPHVTYCGREADGPIVEDLPGSGEKCDTCEEKVIRLAEAMGPSSDCPVPSPPVSAAGLHRARRALPGRAAPSA